jgi:hypothetical protein
VRTNVPVVRYLDDGPDILSGVVGGDCSSMRIQDPVADAGWLGPERRGRFASAPT